MSALADRVEVMLSFRAWRGISQDTRLFLFLALRKNKETKKGKQAMRNGKARNEKTACKAA
jgi:hypothetical protein